MANFYKTTAWLSIREKALQRDNHECQRCKQEGKLTCARSVHHIKSIKEYPMLALEIANLISLCENCHNKAHGKKFKKAEPRFTNEEWW